MSILNTSSFTVGYDRIANVLSSECGVCMSFDPKKETGIHPRIEKFNAIWDTGATNSVITKSVVDKLGLISTGFAKVYHANGSEVVNTYNVNIALPNNVEFHSLRVTEGKLNNGDVLIGMDIISNGDFSVCANEGKTIFSFQFPSTHSIDFVKEFNEEKKRVMHTPVIREKLPGRNNLCHCGSGKKYKNCHGR
jgi:predicted aspartyl protease